MMDDEDETISWDDAMAIASKITEMADRVRVAHAAIPGAQAIWAFEMNDKRFKVVVTVDDGDQA